MKVRELVEKVLKESQYPLSYKQIYIKAQEKGLIDQWDFRGKNAELTIYSSINQDINNKADSKFEKYFSNPVLFGLKSKNYRKKDLEKAKEGNFEEDITDVKEYSEADLHITLASFLAADTHFNCLSKTINHHKAKKGTKNKDEWKYPDMVGVFFPFKSYDDLTLKALGCLQINPFKIFSFELKDEELKPSNIRNYFFQAVSNSSWANEGYLVAPSISSEPEFLQQVSLLNNAFGIGIIQLDIETPSLSRVVFPAKSSTVDADSLNDLITKSDDMRKLFEVVNESQSINKISNHSTFDKVYNDDEYKQKVTENKGILLGLAGRKK